MPAPDGTLTQSLSPHERQALLGISRGRTTAETAVDLGVSECTVKTYLHRIGGELGTQERAAMVDLAYRHHHLDVPAPVTHAFLLPAGQQAILEGLAGGKNIEQIADDTKRPLSDLRKDARRMLRTLGASTAAYAVTRGWQLGLLGPTATLGNSSDVAPVAGSA
ncbi:response regulator transcription factor [Streptomyces sp. 7R007]